MIDIVPVDGSVVGVYPVRWILRPDYQLDGAALFAGGDLKQRMFIPLRLGQDLFQRRHAAMVA